MKKLYLALIIGMLLIGIAFAKLDIKPQPTPTLANTAPVFITEDNTIDKVKADSIITSLDQKTGTNLTMDNGDIICYHTYCKSTTTVNNVLHYNFWAFSHKYDGTEKSTEELSTERDAYVNRMLSRYYK